jgi:retron-type reverse transcriptase
VKVGGGKGLAQHSFKQIEIVQTRELSHTINELLGIKFNIEKAKIDGKVQNLASYINESVLTAIHKGMERDKAVGVDKVTKDEYSLNLEANISNLVKRMKSGAYKPNPTRRTYIPKDGSDKLRPLGISSYEDKLVEKAVAEILNMIYEPKFYNESYGYRLNRNCHQAVREVIEAVQYHKMYCLNSK